METEALQLAAETDFSMWALFARATLIVKLVMILVDRRVLLGLGGDHQQTSPICARASRDSKRFEAKFWSGEPLDALCMTRSGQRLRGASRAGLCGGDDRVAAVPPGRRGRHSAGRSVRIDRSMDVAIQKEAEALQKGLPLLATIGARLRRS